MYPHSLQAPVASLMAALSVALQAPAPDHTAPPSLLTPDQWVLLRSIRVRSPVSVLVPGHFADMRHLLEQHLIALSRTQVCITMRGMESLWYHRLH
ncbi:hypothetical protein ACXU4B_07940 [Dyella soli]|uniref:Uncharacterized protein n=1 Tax=Dyella soli TaxID=522319 RepID=A0A4R0YPM3_9GAMM|nr:hypothetical protein [Dyella soli]TCI10897.1 hypothetical protein EZM97_18840 [Dyella soli]